MLNMEEFLMIRDIAHDVERERGRQNISKFSRRNGYDRRTVKKYLDPDNCPSAPSHNSTSALCPDTRAVLLNHVFTSSVILRAPMGLNLSA